jgi:hypothetical protein
MYVYAVDLKKLKLPRLFAEEVNKYVSLNESTVMWFNERNVHEHFTGKAVLH